jgi:acetoin utilization deacetylase AcuC-like enzyme
LLTFYNEHHAQHAARHELFRGERVPCSEKPERADLVVAELSRRGLGQIVTPHGVPLVSLERVHTPRYLHFLRSAWSEWLNLDQRNGERDALPSVWPIRGMRHDIEPDNFTARLGLYSMDDGTPLTSGTWVAAKTGADCAVNAAHALRLGEHGSFALTRPPGHHAGADYFGGYCFLNNAALAAQHLLDDGLQRVAILDIDYHHGNGTQSIFYHRKDVLFASIHADPRQDYPFYLGHADETGDGEGLGYNMNCRCRTAPRPPSGSRRWSRPASKCRCSHRRRWWYRSASTRSAATRVRASACPARISCASASASATSACRPCSCSKAVRSCRNSASTWSMY